MIHDIATHLASTFDFLGSAIEWLFVTIFIKYIAARYIAEKIKDFLVKTRDDAIRWEHYRIKAIGKHHQIEPPEACDEGACRFIKKPVVPDQNTNL